MITNATPEEWEEFNRVERESRAKQESIRGTKHPTREQLMEELSVAQMLIRELGDRLARLEKPWVDLTKEECFELCVKHKDESFSLLVAVQEKLMDKNT
jgi:ribosomal protein L16 Arg81 hydroxylase